MKKRDKIFIWSAIFIFILTSFFMTVIMDAAQAVGDATLLNPKLKIYGISFVVTTVYGIILRVLFF